MNKDNTFKPRDGYPIIRYHDSDTQVLIGDHVEFRGLFFWKGWQKGRILYVPGLSEEDEAWEHNRIMMVSISDSRGRRSGHAVHSESGRLREYIRFIGRTDDGLGKITGETPDLPAFRQLP